MKILTPLILGKLEQEELGEGKFICINDGTNCDLKKGDVVDTNKKNNIKRILSNISGPGTITCMGWGPI